MKKYRSLLISFAIFGTVTTIILYVIKRMKAKSEEESEEESEPMQTPTNPKYQTDAILMQALIKYLEAYGFDAKLSKMIVAQSRHETGNYSSNLFINYNNPWGMMQPLKRETTSQGATPSGFASYANLDDACKDYVLYLKALGYESTYSDVRAFVSELKKKGYFTDNLTTYMSSVYSIYNNLKISL